MMDLQSSLMLSPTSEQEFSWGGVDSQAAHGRFCPTPSSDESQSSFLETIEGVKNDKKKTSTYKHVPHREKPPHLVARRNARERRRVQAVNGQFAKLRKCVPIENRSKRLSKVKTLQKAIEYIAALQRLLEQDDAASTDKMNNNDIINRNSGTHSQSNNVIEMGNLTIHNSHGISASPNVNANTSTNTSFEQIGEVSSTNTLSSFKQESSSSMILSNLTTSEISGPGSWCPTPTALDQYPTSGIVSQQDYPYVQFQYQSMSMPGAFQSDLQYQCSPLGAYASYPTTSARLSPHSC
ncbi:achaete-scute complex protein T3-like [Varroa jacobsoni]|uniref:BHLH domain-containing protein n=1 Tax=Varroa destructor TaxID=109461 RepID=A0A7M7JXR7_VARDE|nr:achaete-scute complex protein T3-like [Varroa destructor]XP_022691580.1 achaete-scute complex protein T3-like [Varroa jacobsoni]